MDPRSRTAPGLCPGTDPAALWVLTAAMVAGLILSGFSVVAPVGRATRIAQAAAPGPPLLARSAAALPRLSADAGLRLLSQAAVACHRVAFQGVEILSWQSADGPARSVMDVWHVPGGPALASTVSGTPAVPGGTHRFVPPGDIAGGQSLDGDGMLGMSQRLISLLGANFRLSLAGWSDVAGRTARAVTVRRRSGSLAARFWLDRTTSLPLRREVFDHGKVVSNVAFATVNLGRAAISSLPGPAARAWGGTLAPAQLARLRGDGWRFPGPLPKDLTLLDAREAMTGSGTVVDLDYSDGLSVVSVFVERGHLPYAMNGWSEVPVAGREVYADNADSRSLAWSAGGFVYTVVAAAPPQTVSQVVGALPPSGAPGVVARIGHGLRRLLSWMKP